MCSVIHIDYVALPWVIMKQWCSIDQSTITWHAPQCWYIDLGSAWCSHTLLRVKNCCHQSHMCRTWCASERGTWSQIEICTSSICMSSKSKQFFHDTSSLSKRRMGTVHEKMNARRPAGQYGIAATWIMITYHPHSVWSLNYQGLPIICITFPTTVSSSLRWSNLHQIWWESFSKHVNAMSSPHIWLAYQ